MARFKGTTLVYLGPWLDKKFGRARVMEAFNAVPKELWNGLDPNRPDLGALPSSWYDARVYQRLLDEILSTSPERTDPRLAREAARAVLSRTLNGIYAKLFSLMATPRLYARYAQKMWDTHYDTGTVSVQHIEPTVAHHRVEGWAGHHPFVCAINRQSGAIIYDMMGIESVRIVRQTCAPPVCEAVYAWDP